MPELSFSFEHPGWCPDVFGWFFEDPSHNIIVGWLLEGKSIWSMYAMKDDYGEDMGTVASGNLYGATL